MNDTVTIELIDFSSMSKTINNLSTKFYNLSSRVIGAISVSTDNSRRITTIEGTLKKLNVTLLTRNCMSEINDRSF